MLTLIGLIFVTLRAIRFEAEDGRLSGDAQVLTSRTGFSGSGYVEWHDSGGVSITVSVDDDGFFDLVVGYFGAYGDKMQNLLVNGQSFGQISFPETSSFVSIVVAKKLNLKKGSNVIEFTSSWGWQIIDYVELTPFIDTPFDINPKLVNPNATAQAVELYEFLKSNFGKKVISGTMVLPGSTSSREPNWLYENTGKYPALFGTDFIFTTGKGNEWYFNDPVLSQQIVSNASDWYSQGGIVSLMWHWLDPSKATNAFYSPSSGNEYTEFDAEKAADPSTSEYRDILTDIDVVAKKLLELQTKNISVLWRPFHEASGKWFWWGYKGPEALKKLWKIEYDRFTNYHGLNNLIWVWTTDSAADALDWYPGDDYVDIVGADIYPDPGDHNSQVGMFEQLKENFKAKKIVALTECGAIPDPDELVTNGAWWSYFMPWYGDFVIPEGNTPYNSLDFWRKIMKSDVVLTLDELPGWKK